MNTTNNYTSLQPLLFDFSSLAYSYNLTEKENEFASLWNDIVSKVPDSLFEINTFGRKGYPLSTILAVRVIMLFFKKGNISEALREIEASCNLKAITGIKKVPSSSVVSRKTKELIEALNLYSIHSLVINEYFSDRLVCNLSIDSTPVEARETPVKKEKEESTKKGRDKKSSIERKKREKDLANMAKVGDVEQFLSTLENRCSITGKKNSKGYMQWRIGYKIHLAVCDSGIPVSFFVSGASVHDSRVAIPLLRKAKARCTYLYALMDGGYSSAQIEEYSHSIGVVPVIDFKADRNGNKREMDKAKKERYKARTTVERTNSELKECFLPSKIYSRGNNALFDLQLSVLLITQKRIKQRLILEREKKAS